MDGARARPLRTCLKIFGVGFLLFCAYVLSVGPVAYFAKRAGENYEFLRRVYAPVIWLHGNTPLKTPLEKYVELWEQF